MQSLEMQLPAEPDDRLRRARGWEPAPRPDSEGTARRSASAVHEGGSGSTRPSADMTMLRFGELCRMQQCATNATLSDLAERFYAEGDFTKKSASYFLEYEHILA